MYDIAADRWTELPELNTERYNHASCCINGKVYVLFGACLLTQGGVETEPKSIEVLNLRRPGSVWEQIILPLIPGKKHLGCVAVNDNEFVVFAAGKNQGDKPCISRVNLEQKTETFVANLEELYTFSASYFPTVRATKYTVVAADFHTLQVSTYSLLERKTQIVGNLGHRVALL